MDSPSYFSEEETDAHAALASDVLSDLISFMMSTPLSLSVVDLLKEGDASSHYSIIASVNDMIHYKPSMAVNILSNTATLMPLLDEALK